MLSKISPEVHIAKSSSRVFRLGLPWYCQRSGETPCPPERGLIFVEKCSYRNISLICQPVLHTDCPIRTAIRHCI